jgi:hypothetical protein
MLGNKSLMTTYPDGPRRPRLDIRRQSRQDLEHCRIPNDF